MSTGTVAGSVTAKLGTDALGALARLAPDSAARSLALTLSSHLRCGDLYDDGGAEIYEALVAGDGSELPQMLEGARGLRGDVLDLGCGSGRLTFPFLARGHRVTAVDSSRAMLDRLAARSHQLPDRLRDRLQVVHADMSLLPVTKSRYSIILLGTTTVTLLDKTARARTFSQVRDLLAPGGRFFVSTLWFPDTADTKRESVNVTPVSTVDGRVMVVTVFERVDLAAQARQVTLFVQGALGEHVQPALYTSRPSLFPESALRDELDSAGLRVVGHDVISSGRDDRHVVLLTCEAASPTDEALKRPFRPLAVDKRPPPVWEFLVPPSKAGGASRTAVRASGVHVTMADGRRLLCGTSGLWNVNFGYGRPEVRRAVATALDEASYLTLFRYGNVPANSAARALIEAAGANRFTRVVFSTSGSAANDLVMKISRQWAQLLGERVRRLVVGLQGSYHGLTFGSHALSGDELGQDLYGVDRRLVRHVPPGDVDALRDLCEREGDRICAFVIEPVLGSGCHEVPSSYIAEVGRLADEYGFLLVADEVATGYHRTGPFTASSDWDRSPDLLVLSKGLTNGTCAASAVLAGPAVTDAFDRNDAVLVHGETQAGTPVTAAAINAVLDLAARSHEAGDPSRVERRLDLRLQELAADSSRRLGLSGRGCFRGVSVLDLNGTPLAASAAMGLVDAVREEGAIVHPGPHGVQLVPALTYTDSQVDELISALSRGLDRAWDVTVARTTQHHALVGGPR